jgi:hypothetical protein
MASCETEAYGSGWVPVAGTCEHGNEPSGSIKGEEFLDQQSDYYFLKKGFASWSK